MSMAWFQILFQVTVCIQDFFPVAWWKFLKINSEAEPSSHLLLPNHWFYMYNIFPFSCPLSSDWPKKKKIQPHPPVTSHGQAIFYYSLLVSSNSFQFVSGQTKKGLHTPSIGLLIDSSGCWKGLWSCPYQSILICSIKSVRISTGRRYSSRHCAPFSGGAMPWNRITRGHTGTERMSITFCLRTQKGWEPGRDWDVEDERNGGKKKKARRGSKEENTSCMQMIGLLMYSWPSRRGLITMHAWQSFRHCALKCRSITFWNIIFFLVILIAC